LSFKSLAARSLLVLALLSPAAALAAPVPVTAPPMAGVFYDEAYVMGSPKARLEVTEYGSSTCSHCAHFDATVFPDIKARYIDTGKIRYVFREFLTPPEELAAAMFVVARCGGKDHYWPILEATFKAQPEMGSGAKGSSPAEVMERIAKANGIDSARFQACLSDKRAMELLSNRIDHAFTVDKIEGTPTILINGKQVASPPGGWTTDLLNAAINKALPTAAKPAKGHKAKP
jgi:protein-disulfide isomerase